MKTRSTDEAMAVLREYRGFLIDYGRYVATEVCREKGVVHSRDVRRILGDLGLLDHSIGDYWLGAVFNKSRFRWTGQWYCYNDADRNIHEKHIKLWHLPDSALGYALPPSTANWLARRRPDSM